MDSDLPTFPGSALLIWVDSEDTSSRKPSLIPCWGWSNSLLLLAQPLVRGSLVVLTRHLAEPSHCLCSVRALTVTSFMTEPHLFPLLHFVYEALYTEGAQ